MRESIASMAFPPGTDGTGATPGGGWHGRAHADSPRCRSRHAEMGGRSRPRSQAPDRHRRSGRPWCNCKAASDMQNHRRAHWKGDFVCIHPRCLMGTHGSASTLGDSRLSSAPREPARTPYRTAVDHRLLGTRIAAVSFSSTIRLRHPADRNASRSPCCSWCGWRARSGRIWRRAESPGGGGREDRAGCPRRRPQASVVSRIKH